MIGQTVSHYRVVEKLGQGGMGVVYRAEDLQLKRSVALKFLSGELASREARARFLREAQAAASLDHPHICTVHEIGEHEGSAFMVMALVTGGDLRGPIENGPLPTADALDLAIEVAEGLELAHSRGIVHRDIKPANIMIGEDGGAKIMDFGLAKLVDATAMTRSHTTMGTTWYMAPEQVRGRDVDQRADLWSLGVVLYEMLSSRRPFEADQAATVMHLILEEEPRALSEICEGVAQELDWIVSKCLSKDPEQRYQSAPELLHDLRAFRQKQGEGDGLTLTIRARPIKPRRRVPLGPALTVAALLALVVVSYWATSRQQDPLPEPPLQESPWAEPPRVVVTSFENRTGDPALDYLTELAPGTISTGLATTELVDVVPLSVDGSTEELPLSALISASDADIAVTGAFYLMENGVLTIQARAIDARTAGLLFSLPSVDAMRDAPREGIERISQRISGGLAMKLDNPLNLLLPNVPPTYEAFQEYRAGVDALLDDTKWKAMQRFTRAAEIDSLFTRPRVLAPMMLVINPFGGAFADADTMLMSLEAMTDLDDYEITFAKMLREIVNRNHEAALNMALRLEAIAPEDKLVQCNKMIRLGVAGEHERALETYRGLGFSEDQQRRSAIAGTTRIIAGSAHALGQYDLELELRRKLLRYYPGLLLFQLDLLGPFAALAEIDSLHAVVEDGLSRPGTRGFVDYQVWTNSGTLRGHGYHEEAIQFVDWYLERRPARPEDEARKGQINNYAFLLYYAERWEESRAAFETNIASGRLGTGGIETARTWLGLLAARRGDSEFANEIIAEQIDGWDDPYNRSTPYIFRARFAALRGDLDEAVQMLQEAAAHGAKLGHGARHDIDLEPLFGYPPFEELIGS